MFAKEIHSVSQAIKVVQDGGSAERRRVEQGQSRTDSGQGRGKHTNNVPRGSAQRYKFSQINFLFCLSVVFDLWITNRHESETSHEVAAYDTHISSSSYILHLAYSNTLCHTLTDNIATTIIG